MLPTGLDYDRHPVNACLNGRMNSPPAPWLLLLESTGIPGTAVSNTTFILSELNTIHFFHRGSSPLVG